MHTASLMARNNMNCTAKHVMLNSGRINKVNLIIPI